MVFLSSPFQAFLFLGYLNGLLLSVHIVKSQSYFLTYFPAKNLVYALFAPLFAWYAIHIFVGKLFDKPGFFRRFVPWFVAFGLLLVTISYWGPLNPWLTVLWIFGIGFFTEFYRWGILELQERYINPAKVGFAYSYQSLINEFGTISGILFLFLLPSITNQTLFIFTLSLISLQVLVFSIVFFNPRIFEIQQSLEKKEKFFPPFFKNPLYLSFLFIGLFYGLFKAAQETLINSYFQLNSLTRIEIQEIISQAFLIGSFLQIGSSYFNARVLEPYRTSPFSTLVFSWILFFTASFYVIQNPSLFGYMLLLSTAKGFAGLYFPSLAKITGAFDNTQKITLRTIHFWGAVALTSFIFYFIPPTKINLSNLIYFSFAGILITIFILKKYFYKDLKNQIQSEDLSSSIRATIGLSYIKPKDYVDSVEKILTNNPHSLLKKQIILSLGYFTENERSVDILLKEFNSDKEEIQITVVEALKLARSNKSTRFLLDLVLSNKKTLTPRVRFNASQIIATLYQQKSIPILMLGLQEEDHRMVANVIEALSQFQNKELVDVYKKYTESRIPRVKANALMALFKYNEEQDFMRTKILETLNSKDSSHIGEQISIFYVIGKNKLHEFKKNLIQIHKNQINFDNAKNLNSTELSYIQTLSWALIRLQSESGYESLLKLFVEVQDLNSIKSILHFFVQLEKIEKFECLDKWILIAPNKKDVVDKLIILFSQSGFDFSNEIQYLKSLNIDS